MGGVGFTELLLLAVVALIVLGPERLPAMARTAGRLTRQARRAWQGLQSELQSELDAEHNRRIMDATSGRAETPSEPGAGSGGAARPGEKQTDDTPSDERPAPKRDDDAD